MKRSELWRRAFRAWGRHSVGMWTMWPGLFWLNILVASVNTASAVIIILVDPDLAWALSPPLLLMSVVLLASVTAGLMHVARHGSDGRSRDDN